MLAGPAAAERPVEIELRPPCPSCTCATCVADCDCWAGMAAPAVLARVRSALEAEFPGRVQLPAGLRVERVPARSLEVRYGEKVLGLYQAGVISIVETARGTEAVRILAHEVGHAWLGADEGKAEWVAYRVMSRLGYPTTSLLRGPYGAQLRRMLELDDAEVLTR